MLKIKNYMYFQNMILLFFFCSSSSIYTKIGYFPKQPRQNVHSIFHALSAERKGAKGHSGYRPERSEYG